MSNGNQSDRGSVDASFDLRLPTEALRWRCDQTWLDFKTTAEVEPITGIVGQEDAVEALRFGLEIDGPGQNIYVRGLAGSGRLTLVRQLMEQIQPPCPPSRDRCYVHNFAQPDRPRLITLPRGAARKFRDRVGKLIEFIQDELQPALSSDALRARREALDDRLQRRVREIGRPFEDELRENGLALVPIQAGQTVQPAILPVIDGKPVPVEQFRELRAQGRIDDATAEQIAEKTEAFAKRFQKISTKMQTAQAKHRDEVSKLYEKEARSILGRLVKGIEKEFAEDSVKRFLADLVDDLVEYRLRHLAEDTSYSRVYQVNPVLAHADGEGCPIIVENSPTLRNLLGDIEREFLQGGMVRSDHLMIQAGSLLRASGGFLVLEARDVLREPGAWKVLMRTLRTGTLEIMPSEMQSFWSGPLLKPEPIDISVKVVLLGDPGLYHLLDANDPDFSQLFKVLADFDTTIPRDKRGVEYYAGVMARMARDEELPHFSSGGIGALAEQGARVAGQRERLTTRFSRLSDTAREAAFLANKDGRDTVRAADVNEAVRRGKRRADLPARRFRKLVAEGTIRINTRGRETGQVNGLAVIHAGPLTYGFPTRITATIGPGSAGAINIEREAALSGSIHTKGFYILGGLLRHLLRTEHPLAFSASIAFEQSYGGIDGDSASGAEMCCLLSALTGVPLRQNMAMTGAIDQVGHIQPVGATTEKVEGFFDTCNDLGLTGDQGVIIPRANAGDLMLRPDVVEACEQDRFHVYAVSTVNEALQILTGREIGNPSQSGSYPIGTLLHLAVEKARDYWRMARTKP